MFTWTACLMFVEILPIPPTVIFTAFCCRPNFLENGDVVSLLMDPASRRALHLCDFLLRSSMRTIAVDNKIIDDWDLIE
jgi:hypothetical protein